MTSMSLEELQEELHQVRKRLAVMDKDTAAYRAGTLIESAILYSINIAEKMNESTYHRRTEVRKDNTGPETCN